MAATSASAPALPAAEGAAAADSASAASPDVSNSVFDASDPQLAAGGRYNKQLNTALDLLQEMLTPTSKCNWKLASSKKVLPCLSGHNFLPLFKTLFAFRLCCARSRVLKSSLALPRMAISKRSRPRRIRELMHLLASCMKS